MEFKDEMAGPLERKMCKNYWKMNKTININLGGVFFHIDEIAYQKLKSYLDFDLIEVTDNAHC